MSTKIYGASDDLIEFDGDVRGEACGNFAMDEDDRHRGAFIACSDGTILSVCYGKPDHGGVWAINVIEKGPLFDALAICTDEDADPYSDVATFKDGLKWAYICQGKWERVS